MKAQGRTTNEPKELDKEEVSEGVEELEAPELGALGIDDTFDRKMSEWLAKANYENLTTTVTLYKYENPNGGEEKAQCGQWQNDIPDAHTIGLTYGSGRYLILVTFPQGKRQPRGIKGYRFKLHPHYDELRRQHQQQVALGLAAPTPISPFVKHGLPSQDGNNAIDAGLRAVAEVVKAIAPLIQQKQSPVFDPSLMGAMMLSQYKTMSALMKENLLETQELLASKLTNNNEHSDEGAEEPTILEQLAPLIAQYVPILLGRGARAEATAATVRSLPQFRKLLQNRGELTKIIGYLDKEIGREKTDALLRKLRVSRPALPEKTGA